MAKARRVGTSTALAAAWRASRGGLCAVLLFSACVNLLKFAMPLYLLQVLDRIPASRSVETLIMLTAVTLFAVTAGLALDFVRRRMLTRWGVWIERRFGPQIVHKGLSESTQGASADLGRALGDVGRLRTFVTQQAVSWLDVIWTPLFFVGVYLIHPLLGTVTAIAVAALVVLGILEEWLTRDSRRASGDASRAAGDLMLAAERNKESVGALSMAPNLTEKWRQSASSRLSERERIETRTALFSTLTRGLGSILRIGLIAFGIWLFLTEGLTLGGIFAARVMAGFGYGLAERAVRNWRTLREAGSAYANIKRLLAGEPEIPASVLTGTSDAPLILDMVTFRYPGQRDDVFRRLSFAVAPGEMLLVSGTAATGKSTLSRLLVGVLEPRYGQVRLGDVVIARLPEDLRASLIGYLPQHTELFDGTVRENIARMGDTPFDAVVAAAQLAGIHELVIRLDKGYDTPIGHDGFSGLSGSERKRIAMARAFLNMPRFIVLDEPTANLDQPSRRIMEAAIKDLKSQGCSIVATQGIQSARMSRLANKFLILGGRVPEVTMAEPEDKKKAELRSVK